MSEKQSAKTSKITSEIRQSRPESQYLESYPYELIQRAIENPSSATLTPDVIEVLQRTHGNQFVLRLLNQAQKPDIPAKLSPPISITPSPIIQRDLEDYLALGALGAAGISYLLSGNPYVTGALALGGVVGGLYHRLSRPAGQLTATKLAGLDREGNCGEVGRYYKWNLAGVQGPGIIVQKVERTFSILNLNTSANMNAAAVDTYVAGAGKATTLNGWQTYWEAWTIPPGATHTGQPHDDEFVLVRISDSLVGTKNKTKGWYQIKGTATFYPYNPPGGLTPASLNAFGFSVTPASPAGVLPVSQVAPTGLPRPSSNTFTHTVKVAWDCSQKDTTSPYKSSVYGETKVLIDT